MLSILKFNHCVFDFDGVIVDSEKKKFKDMRSVLKKYDIFLKDDDFSKFVGKKRGFFLRENFSHLLNDTDINEIMKNIHELDTSDDSLILVEDFMNFLNILYDHKIVMHIATGSSKKFVLNILNKFGIKKYFSNIITGDDVIESKPSPEIYLKIKKIIGNESIFVVEDSIAGVLSAKSAGLFVVSFVNIDSADIYVQNFKEILNSLNK